MIPECYVPAVLKLVHDTVIAGHPGRERTLTAARAVYFWPTMRVDVDAYVAKCIKCAQHKGTVPRPAVFSIFILMQIHMILCVFSIFILMQIHMILCVFSIFI